MASEDHEFALGDYVRIRCEDGAEFEGVLQDFTDEYVLLDGYGFPEQMIEDMWHA